MFICILIVFIVIVTLVIFLEKKNIYNYFYNLFTNFEGYRLGDIYNGNGGDDAENYVIKNKKKFKNTIAYKYIINRKKKLNDIETLNNIIKNHCNINFTNDCIIHIRTGDVLENETKETINKRWNSDEIENKNQIPSPKNHVRYINNKKYYLSKIIKLKKLNINRVTIISGSHYKLNNFNNSTYFINLVKELFEKNNFTVKLKLARSPDEDVCLIYNSKYFIPGKGGYSRLLTDIVKYNKKIII